MNTNNSTLSTQDTVVKLKSIKPGKSIVSKSLAHEELLLFSPVSVGIFPSNRTLVVGVLQLDEDHPKPTIPVVTLEQRPTGDEPFTDSVKSVGKMKFDGTTKEIIQ